MMHPRLPHCVLLWSWLWIALLGLQPMPTRAQAPKDFDQRTFTELNQSYWHSADTFSLKVRVKNGTRSQHFRLHGINAPEPDDLRPTELTGDSARFRLPPGELIQWGDHARQAVSRTLQGGGTIYTRRLPAGELENRRYVYAVVLDAQGRDVAQLLVDAGLAVHDPDASPLPSSRSIRGGTDLQRGQELAMLARRGIWAHARDAIPALPLPSSPQTIVDAIPTLTDKAWIIYENGHLAENFYTSDGDSFALTAKLRTSQRSSTQVWRLYAVDCPESSAHIPERVATQAKHFGVSNATVINYGKRATAFTRKFLAQGPATIYTIREDARGATAKNRYYALIRVNGQDLGLALVREGLALSGSMPLPTKSREVVRFRQLLDRAEDEARAAGRGIWQTSSKR